MLSIADTPDALTAEWLTAASQAAGWPTGPASAEQSPSRAVAVSMAGATSGTVRAARRDSQV